ncbi:MAG: hypothetical protein ACXABY_22775, partial [Candidatus Thorarchaeota archaeon]
MNDFVNGRISDLFLVLKVGEYDEPLWKIMTRIKREMNLEYCRNPKPWYPFAYQQNLPDTRI